MKTLLIVWCSTTGGTRQMGEAAERGARGAAAADELEVRRLQAAEARAEDLLAADGLVLATPEHLGSMAGPMKDFLDRAYYPCLDRVNGRPWALLVCAGSDGQGTIRQAERIATGLRLRRVAEPVLVITHAQTPEAILAPKKIGEADLARGAEGGRPRAGPPYFSISIAKTSIVPAPPAKPRIFRRRPAALPKKASAPIKERSASW